jgi:hypothetical protein
MPCVPEKVGVNKKKGVNKKLCSHKKALNSCILTSQRG